MEIYSFWFSYQIAKLKGSLPSSIRYFNQQRKLKRLMKQVKATIPFYQEKANLGFYDLPYIDKILMDEQFEKMNVEKLTQEACLGGYLQALNYNPNYSLGTTGKESIYLFTDSEKYKDLTSILSQLLPINKWPQKIAVFYLSKTPCFTTIKSPFLKWQFFDIKSNLENYVQALTQFSPDVIVAPVQTLCQIAHLYNGKKLPITPKKLVATYEVLTPIEEKLIATTFKQNVHQLYQCAEGFLGTTCEMGTMHLNEDNYFIEKEWVDEHKDKFIPVITTLHRRMQPLVRYRMNDILCLKKTPCSCGSTKLAVSHIVGRCEDMLCFQKKGSNLSLKTIYADDIHLAIGKASGGIEKYQLVQSTPFFVELKLKASNFALAKQCILQQLEKLSDQQGVRCPVFEFTSFEAPLLHELFRQTRRKSAMLAQGTPPNK